MGLPQEMPIITYQHRAQTKIHQEFATGEAAGDEDVLTPQGPLGVRNPIPSVALKKSLLLAAGLSPIQSAGEAPRMSLQRWART